MKSLLKRLISLSVFISAFAVLSCQAFIVRNIEIHGLQNLLSSTVRSYIPLQEGQDLTTAKSDQVVLALYKTGFFDNVSLLHRGNTLIIDVKERPMITLIKIEGNKEISTSKIEPVMKKIGLAPGQILDPLKLTLFTRSLEQQYAIVGYNATSVTPHITPLSHNRVSITVNVDEGKIVKLGGIEITGNNAFSQRVLIKQFHMTTPGIFTIFSHKDRFSQSKLEKDLQRLINFYLNNGYVRARIVSHKVVYSPDRKRATVYIKVNEGPLYRIKALDITGQTLGRSDELRKYLTIKPGDVFSRIQIIRSEKIINMFYADKAYAFVQVAVVPTIDDQAHTVVITFNVVSGKPVYVRRIQFSGNDVTSEEVLRREMRQMEAAPYSLSAINESKRRLMLTNYFANATVASEPVLGTNNQVDLNVTVKEKPSGKASVQGGWSSAYGFLYGASISQPNFLGTGKYVSVGFNNSQIFQNYFFSYVNPYYTWYNISRGISVFYNHSHYQRSLNFTPYTMDSFGADLSYGFPISENNTMSIDFGYAGIDISHINNQGQYAPSVIDFINPTPAEAGSTDVKRSYNLTKMVGKWSYGGLDRAQMPTQGIQNIVSMELGVPILSNNLAYYILSENITGYLPLTHGFILNALASVGYGQSYDGTNIYPFFDNFYAGGIGTVPGYQSNSLGPKYGPYSANYGAALGGNLLTTAGAHLILPNFLSDQVRMALTFDAGNVFQSPIYGPNNTAVVPGTSNPALPLVIQNDAFAFKNFRMSAGLLVIWYTPFFGPIDLSLAFPLNKRPYDMLEPFQFAMGMSF